MSELPYPILIGTGLLARLSDLLAEHCPAAAYAVITDSSVEPLYARAAAEALGARAHTVLLPFPAGEWNKTRDTWTSLTDRMLEARLGRDAAVVAIGGGVVGDLAGFVAATYLRGVPVVQVPTSLLAMIDSSVGGKAGVDTSHGKNLVGAFHQPRAVIADLTTLTTLPPLHVAAGIAEALKHGAIADRAYFARTVQAADTIRAREAAVMDDVVRRSVEIKSAVVAEDARETGRRAILNFGHTIAHALEAVTGYELLHGEAVALGMLVEARLGEAFGVTDAPAVSEIGTALTTFDLPTHLPDSVTPQALLDVMQHDKKVRDGTVRFALIERVGAIAVPEDGAWTHAVPADLVLESLRAGS